MPPIIVLNSKTNFYSTISILQYTAIKYKSVALFTHISLKFILPALYFEHLCRCKYRNLDQFFSFSITDATNKKAAKPQLFITSFSGQSQKWVSESKAVGAATSRQKVREFSASEAISVVGFATVFRCNEHERGRRRPRVTCSHNIITPMAERAIKGRISGALEHPRRPTCSLITTQLQESGFTEALRSEL